MHKTPRALVLILGLSLSSLAAQTEFYVSPAGNDANNGTLAQPFLSLEKVQETVRTLTANMTGDLVVILRGGVYPLTKPLAFAPADSARNGHRIIYKAYPDETPVISGGRKVTGWTQHAGSIYKAQLDYDLKLRALYVNGIPASMARGVLVKGQGGWGEFVITGKEPWAQTPGSQPMGIKFKSSEFGLYQNPEDIELVSQPSTWCRQRAAVKDIFQEGDFTIAKMVQPGFALVQGQKWGRRTPSHPWQAVNAFELLDEAGEFYFNKKTKTLYYYKRAEEDLATANVVAPILEKLITLTGTSTDERVSNISFSGIAFKHNNFLLMERGKKGCGTIQATAMTVKYRQDGNWHKSEYNMTRPMDAAIEVSSAEGINFTQCRFENLTGIGLSFLNDTVDCHVKENIFQYIEASALNLGHPQHYKIGDGEIFGDGVEGPCKGSVVRNNVLRHISYEHIQAPGIVAYFVADTDVSHNDLKGFPYSGISFGWWWKNSKIPPSDVMRNNRICNNRIDDVLLKLNDGGHIYTLGYSPDSRISGNYLTRAHGIAKPGKNKANGIHPDGGASYWSIENNVIEEVNGHAISLWSKDCHDSVARGNFSNGALFDLKGTASVFEENVIDPLAPPWTDPRALEIIKNAGLEPRCRHLLNQIN
ncbi:right-handed parallel beta-helix repeat-containing protein [Pontiella sulfatireligans]|uniref:Right handed beta helix domain-containing protein n=1 Tax=Pontiella sulfatireligans TaxID=2750658 RepID=A0A6C2UD25_9BACT|nr:right-handed parallel beta-helix repeat-containing protein [Pontiella sulfatireligans]VGO18025.1 hypothetical protein SCARR_00075 [Pontiella sulfatireligans]